MQTYWTNIGDGVAPDTDYDTVGGSLVIKALPSAYSVSGDSFIDDYVIE